MQTIEREDRNRIIEMISREAKDFTVRTVEYSPRFLEDNAQRQLGHNTNCHVNDHHRSENYRSEETRNENRNPRYEEINENTEEENHLSLPHTFSDSFLPRGRPPTWGY